MLKRREIPMLESLKLFAIFKGGELADQQVSGRGKSVI